MIEISAANDPNQSGQKSSIGRLSKKGIPHSGSFIQASSEFGKK
jgi:hypothetical protein